MQSQKSVKVIFDTNIWISFLISKRLQYLHPLIASGNIKIILSYQLLSEIRIVSERDTLKKYFSKDTVDELFKLFESIGEIYTVASKYTICRDPKDNFLLDLAAVSKAAYLVTGDKDLIALNPFISTKVITPKEFETIVFEK